MSQVEHFHTHTYKEGNNTTGIVMPGWIHECDDPQCKQERQNIEMVAHCWNEAGIQSFIEAEHLEIRRHMKFLDRYREALALRRRNDDS